MGKRRLKLAAEPPLSRWRNTLDARLLAANRLLLGVRHELDQVGVQDAADELARRGLELLTSATSEIAAELRRKLHAVRLPLELGGCPHCATDRPALPTGHCPRCNGMRGVSDGEGKSGGSPAVNAR